MIFLGFCRKLVNRTSGTHSSVTLETRACSNPELSVFPFCNISLPIDTRVDDLIARLTDDEKPPLLTARESPLGDVSRLGLPEYDWGLNCIHGVQSRCGTKCPTSFPTPPLLTASFNMRFFSL